MKTSPISPNLPNVDRMPICEISAGRFPLPPIFTECSTAVSGFSGLGGGASFFWFFCFGFFFDVRLVIFDLLSVCYRL